MTKQEIILELKNEILNLSLKPGDLLSEAILSERYGLSRTPIRDILKQLEASGYINIYPQKGSKVSYVDLDSVEQIIYLRHALEKELFRDLRQTMTVSSIHQLTLILVEQEKCLEKKHPLETFMSLDDAFHRTCFEMAGRMYLWDLIQQNIVHYARYRQLHMVDGQKLRAIVTEHKQLLEYLKGCDLSLEHLMYQHIRADIHNTVFKETYLDYIQDPSH